MKIWLESKRYNPDIVYKINRLIEVEIACVEEEFIPDLNPNQLYNAGVKEIRKVCHSLYRIIQYGDEDNIDLNLVYKTVADIFNTYYRYKKWNRRHYQKGMREFVYNRDGYKCVVCGREERLTLDHVIPASQGGETTTENLRTLCYYCNLRKGTRGEDFYLDRIYC